MGNQTQAKKAGNEIHGEKESEYKHQTNRYIKCEIPEQKTLHRSAQKNIEKSRYLADNPFLQAAFALWLRLQ